MGVQVEELPDGLVIHGTGAVQGGTVDGCNDHRIVMAFSVAAAYAASDSVIKQALVIVKEAVLLCLHFRCLCCHQLISKNKILNYPFLNTSLVL